MEAARDLTALACGVPERGPGAELERSRLKPLLEAPHQLEWLIRRPSASCLLVAYSGRVSGGSARPAPSRVVLRSKQ